MGKIRVSAVKYANTYPFIYGLIESGFYKKIILETDHPAACAAKLKMGSVDIGLIPVAAIPDLDEYHIVGDYCIGANGEVRTVMLLSNTDFNDIETVYLDYRSRSSVALSQVLASNFWKRDFKWVNTSEGFSFETIGPGEATVLIGDQCFGLENNFRFKTDLALEWKKHTGLPFVFACWVANKNLDSEFLTGFNNALKTGVSNIDAVVDKMGRDQVISGEVLRYYLRHNIDFDLNESKRKAMDLFLSMLNPQ